MKMPDEKYSHTVCAVEGTRVLDTQVGGHRYGHNGKKLGMLDRGNGIVLKALQTPPRGTRELNLYQAVFDPACSDKDLLELRHFLPLYYGCEVIDGVTFLLMNNLTHNVSKANVLDLKMGPVSYDPEASPQKQKYEQDKYPPRTQLGFRLSGMMTHDPVTGKAQHYHKSFYLSITTENVLREGLGKFFGLEYGRLRKDVVVALLQKLHCIEAWFKVQRKYAFYASSLLIVYSSSEPHYNIRKSSIEQDASSASKTAEQLGSTANEHDEVAQRNTEQCVSDPRRADHWDSRTESHGDSHGSSKLIVDGSAQKSTEHVNQIEPPADISTSLEHHVRPAQDVQNVADGRGLLSQLSDTPSQIPPSDSSIQHPSWSKSPRQHSSKKRELGSSSESFPEESPVQHPCKKREIDPHCDKPEEGEDSEKSPENSKPHEDKVDVEGRPGSGKFKGVCKSAPPLVEVRMIDFAHVFPSSNMDTNYLFGLQKLIGYLEQLLTL